MSQFVGQDLDLSWFESRSVFDHVVGRRVDWSLTHRLRNQVEVVPLRQGDNIVENRSARWIDVVALLRVRFLEESAVDTLANHDVGEGGLDVVFLQEFLDLHDFLVFDQLNLTVANAVSVNNDSSGEFLVDLFVPEIKIWKLDIELDSYKKFWQTLLKSKSTDKKSIPPKKISTIFSWSQSCDRNIFTTFPPRKFG